MRNQEIDCKLNCVGCCLSWIPTKSQSIQDGNLKAISGHVGSEIYLGRTAHVPRGFLRRLSAMLSREAPAI